MPPILAYEADIDVDEHKCIYCDTPTLRYESSELAECATCNQLYSTTVIVQHRYKTVGGLNDVSVLLQIPFKFMTHLSYLGTGIQIGK